MLLIVIYSLSAVLVFLNIEPLKIAAIFLGICYLPGLSLLTYGKRGHLAFEDLVLAFPCSIGISSIVIVGLLFSGVHVQFISYIIYVLTGAVVLLCAIKNVHMKITLTSKEIGFFFFALLITLLFSMPILLGADRVAISSHGFFHSTFATQILNGIFPPENPGLGGAKISYQWVFHAFIATIASLINFHPLQVISVLNLLSLFIVFCIVYQSSKVFGFSECYRYLVCLAVIGLMRSDAGIFFVNKLLAGDLMNIKTAELTAMRPLDLLQHWVWGGGAPWYDRRLFFINKFYNANTMPLGIALCFAYFMLMLKVLDERFSTDDKKIYLLILSVVIIGCALIYPPIAIIPLLHAPLWIAFDFLLKKGAFKERLKHVSKILTSYCIAVVCILPFLLFITKSNNNVQGEFISLDFYDQSIKNVVTFWLPTPVIFLGVWVAIKRLAFSRELYFLLISALLCLGLSVFMRLPMLNSAKFTFVLSFFLAVFFVFAVTWLLTLISKPWVKKFVAAGVVLFLLMTPFITVASFIVSPWFSDTTYAFSGGHIIFAQDAMKNEAYAWIRDNTPPESLVMLTYVETMEPDDVAPNTTYEPAALTERNLFVIKDSFTIIDPEYAKRVSIRDIIIEHPVGTEVKGFLNSLNRPVYLLVEDDLPPFYLRGERFRNLPEDIGKGFLLEFRNAEQRVYLIQSSRTN